MVMMMVRMHDTGDDDDGDVDDGGDGDDDPFWYGCCKWKWC